MALRRTAAPLLTSLLLACGTGTGETVDSAGPAPDAGLAASASAPDIPGMPSFAEHAVAAVDIPDPAEPDLGSASYGERFRTVLRTAARGGPNFAGQYVLATWGCGSACQVTAVIDARTGRLSAQTLLTRSGIDFRRESALVIADPPDPAAPADCESCGTTAAYVWRGDRFEPVGNGPHPHLAPGTP